MKKLKPRKEEVLPKRVLDMTISGFQVIEHDSYMHVLGVGWKDRVCGMNFFCLCGIEKGFEK